ncbi:MAG TPA: hypothetical protein VE961_17855 [Pyrinomonadaceae bacterium]|nr:hypothetical protein [Pyrinomonadaceae bacterium]
MEKETTKLINVLRRIARAAGYVAWAKSEPDALRFCVTQYNKVLARLGEREPNVKTLFTSLPETTAPEVVRIAARELVAYFEDEAPEAQVFKFSVRCGPRAHHRGRGRFQTTPLHCE